MRFHKSVPKIAKVCYHGIDINMPCVKCIEYFIRDHQTSIKILKQQLKIVKKKHSKKKTKRTSQEFIGLSSGGIEGISFNNTKRGRRK